MITVIIPTYNESENIRPCLDRLTGKPVEVIVADSPKSSDNLQAVVKEYGFRYIISPLPGRNHQMNSGAQLASGNILYFVHADTLVHHRFDTDIPHALSSEADMGCYRFKFDRYPYFLMYINSFFTRFPMIWCRGGDQTLFIKKEVFEALKGFCTKHEIMEDYDILLRSKDRFTFQIIAKDVIVSARKYETNGYWRVLMANFKVMRKWLRQDAEPGELRTLYNQLLNYR